MHFLRSVSFLLLIYGCQSGNSNVNIISRTDSFRNSLIGKWGALGEGGPVLRITHDSIHYYSENRSYPYEIIGNDLVFDNGQSKPNFKNISVIKDTLFFDMRASVEREVYIKIRAFRHN